MTHITPGPWRRDGINIKAVDHGVWFTIARANCQKLTPEGMADNARVMAAAPELLAAAVEALKCIEANVPASVFAPRQWLREAIAKAGGAA